jgi:hypothetical protein
MFDDRRRRRCNRNRLGFGFNGRDGFDRRNLRRDGLGFCRNRLCDRLLHDELD